MVCKHPGCKGRLRPGPGNGLNLSDSEALSTRKKVCGSKEAGFQKGACAQKASGKKDRNKKEINRHDYLIDPQDNGIAAGVEECAEEGVDKNTGKGRQTYNPDLQRPPENRHRQPGEVARPYPVKITRRNSLQPPPSCGL